jgi:hypothetical protein
MAVITTPHQAKVYAKAQMKHWGWNKAEWVCLHTLWAKESNWRPKAHNKQPVVQVRDSKRVKLYAGGIPQILGLKPSTPVPQQIDRGFTYIKSRYGSPCAAMRFWSVKKWY